MQILTWDKVFGQGERKVVNRTESYTTGRLENFLDLFV